LDSPMSFCVSLFPGFLSPCRKRSLAGINFSEWQIFELPFFFE
jgi:hypothetical protein